MIPIRDSEAAQSRPWVTYGLIALNLWIFLYEILLGPELEGFVRTWGFIPARYFLMAELYPEAWLPRYVPLVTCMFLHGGWAHLIGNMLYLRIFGDNVEDRLGHLRYLGFYLATGVIAALAQAYLYPDSTVPTVGASGAISGVLGAFLVMFPHARVMTVVPLLIFFPLIEIPAVVYLGFWFLMQVLNGTMALAVMGDSGGVAWWAHVGGFAAGMALAPLLRRRQSYPRAWRDQYAPW
ncbi:MAG TPA: rhomboid family intramembrane serine protease [Candidatus Udaeobacter sp.]|nr:rhomboid family intramembrane serine protease [Candidatus Udaeobacter sp.]